MRILISTPGMQPPWVDGRITSLLSLMRALTGLGVEIQVLTTSAVTAARNYRQGDVDYCVLPGGSRRNWLRLLATLWDMCSSGEIDLVLYRPFAGFNLVNVASVLMFRLVSLLRRVPFVLSLWSGPEQLLRFPWLASGILLTSHTRRRDARIAAVAPIIDLHNTLGSGDERALEAYGIRRHERVCLFTYCASVDTEGLWRYTMEERGLGDLIAAASHLRDLTDFKILVSMPMLSQASARARLEGILDDRGVRQLFVLAAEIGELAPVLSCADAYVYPLNMNEPSWAPVSILEAFACETPVITTSIPLIMRYVSTDEVLLCAPGSDKDLAVLIRRALSGSNDVRSCVARAKARVLRENSSREVAADTLEILSGFVATHKGECGVLPR